ncbi:MAG: HU family DNA-binding protein [Leptospiraceae bacterium]|nr:HU family DNA-binding protein [Leptospiraceae bacterium]MCP5494935.1 HU family DNA-binding protein [Leptospiraceae bacterium]
MAVAKPTPMKKSQIITELATTLNKTKKEVSDFLDALVSLTYKETKKNGSFAIPGIGKLTLKKTKKRKGRNPATGAEIDIPAKTVVKASLFKACKEAIVPPPKKK